MIKTETIEQTVTACDCCGKHKPYKNPMMQSFNEPIDWFTHEDIDVCGECLKSLFIYTINASKASGDDLLDIIEDAKAAGTQFYQQIIAV